MRSATAIFLLASLTVPFIALYLRTHVEIRKVRKEVKHRLIENTDRSALVLLSFSHAEAASSLDWKHSKEFEHRGQLYDVVERDMTNDSVHYWCWWDHEETALYKQLDQLMANLLMRDPAQQSRQQHLTEFFKSLYCETLPVPSITLLLANLPSFPDKTHHIYTHDDKPPSPPPWLG